MLLTSSGDMADVNPLRYRGYFYDTEAGLYYLKSRYYDPEVGRFINSDEVTSTGQGILGTNMFAYCGNSPLTKADCSGQFWHIAVGAVIGAIVNVASSYIMNKLAGNDYSLENAAQDAIVGALSGGLAASGVSQLGQQIGNGIISAASTAYSSYKESGKINRGKTGASFFLGFGIGRYGGIGLATGKKMQSKLILSP